MWYYLCFYVILSVVRAQEISPTVVTAQGPIVGSLASDGDYYVYLGVPYGGSTSGQNRFKAPTQAPLRTGTLNATQRVLCAQYDTELIGVEDCLTADIYTSDVNSTQPVLVWLQSEQYATTDNEEQSFRVLVEAGFVVVRLNYRLGVFGFLCLHVPQAPGNAGIKDVLLGLQWINENIARFGGDKDNVMLFGHESGAAIADLISLSRKSEGLIHKVLAQSGTALSPWAVDYTPIKNAKFLAEKHSFDYETLEDLADSFLALNLSTLVQLRLDFDFRSNAIEFGPCLEEESLENTFLIEAPIDLIRTGNFNHVPYVTGYTTKEGTLRLPQYDAWYTNMQINFSDFVPVDLEFESIENKTAEANIIRDLYFGTSGDVVDQYFDYHGDIAITMPVIRNAKERALTSTAEVRLYEFGYIGTENSEWDDQIPLKGAKHGDVLKYLLNQEVRVNSTDRTAQTSLVARMVEFSKTGKPEPVNYTVWFPITATSTNYLRYGGGNYNNNPNQYTISESALSNPRAENITFWKDIYRSHYFPPAAPTSSSNVVVSFSLGIIFCQILHLFLY